ncbi:hypothetical protein MCOR27_000244 [Pyricularia oryzae]|uniref:UBL3-like ubiquitin domain-containing protein n=2 Tax=Pyricularia TaxID=48558 RepID=A0ABQ8N4X6_PYRGI|nr:hypothetical protein MCOR01_003043 [Pyricularia oryzae]KAI6291365.1 hypothetical protein MCOR33_010679 [Pyricularia grisea]KAH9432676.1 hypothetical protein MCOR02_007363 [Pyricularia oryzae]KAI6258505.1 hypothetical protein MCOR19_005152 [Pyricularia oryzae]KAI6282291.1 hypothetical protein MCOR26_002866 [Pyricularia oryzae]
MSQSPSNMTNSVANRDDPKPTPDTSALGQPKGAVEMSNIQQSDDGLDAQKPTGATATTSQPLNSTDSSIASAAIATSYDGEQTPSAAAKGKEKETGDPSKREDSLSIDPAGDNASLTSPGGADPANPACNITLLLPTGARHPYRIDERYLSKRNVEIPDLTEDGKRDPFSISIYKLKELILREWRDEWESRPASPSSIRLIHFGKLLDDKEQLKKYQFSAEAPNVIHMSVKPAEMMEEEEGAKTKGSGAGGRTREGGGCCVIL